MGAVLNNLGTGEISSLFGGNTASGALSPTPATSAAPPNYSGPAFRSLGMSRTAPYQINPTAGLNSAGNVAATPGAQSLNPFLAALFGGQSSAETTSPEQATPLPTTSTTPIAGVIGQNSGSTTSPVTSASTTGGQRNVLTFLNSLWGTPGIMQ